MRNDNGAGTQTVPILVRRAASESCHALLDAFGGRHRRRDANHTPWRSPTAQLLGRRSDRQTGHLLSASPAVDSGQATAALAAGPEEGEGGLEVAEPRGAGQVDVEEGGSPQAQPQTQPSPS